MKKAAIITMISFYLLLTTGMYVCILYCATEMLSEKPVMQMAVSGTGKHHTMMDCNAKKEHSCCQKHGNYVIKENLKTGSELQFTHVVAIINPLPGHYFASRPVVTTIEFGANCNAPPWQSGKSRTIQFRSIQI